ncbi:type II toxin-antitoxin system RelE/ParE family toxin [Ramlibacter sp. H39-3-26]|uniref:type II toxin-antitoxin system RelE/ParE family toxin n=1 Tax=Curvibacter soli TaxID=3031331 RepID=UPI0023DB1227|nr:type II toxin-antitoxin system RelE/ParE family toxin [Ramlibacter sp. H39-3-26]MDF1485308.1 type II toxin-antitoxin system RelE/ParE family toxin [Ramlibacter sp. H39-3-26]
MTARPAIRRARASRDGHEAIGYYLEQQAPQTAEAFVLALEQAIAHIRRHPATGSPRYAHALGLAGLRCWPCKRFPYLVFYLERPNHIDIWRILHGQRDIQDSLLGGDES